LTDPLESQLGEIRRRYRADVRQNDDGSRLITVRDFPLPPGWNKEAVTVRFLVPVGYPFAGPDSFWADPSLRTAGQAMPINTAMQQPWTTEPPLLWFSWHPERWNPQQDTLMSYLGVIASRFRKAK
jgi:hypothetical protein